MAKDAQGPNQGLLPITPFSNFQPIPLVLFCTALGLNTPFISVTPWQPWGLLHKFSIGLSTWSWTSWIVWISVLEDFTNMSMKTWPNIWLRVNSTKISKPFTQIFMRFFSFSQIAPIFKSAKWCFNTTYKHTKFQLIVHLNVKYDFKASVSWRVQNDYHTSSWLGCNYITLNVECGLKSKYVLKGLSLELVEKILG